MKFALLGCDPDTLALALAVAQCADHELVWGHDLGAEEPAIRAAAGILYAEHWEGLLAGNVADVVIVSRARDQELRAEQLRKLAQAGLAMIISHPVVESMLVYYELDMIRQESHAVMQPYTPGRWHPIWQQLAESIGEGGSSSLGSLEQIVVEHTVADRSRGNVFHAFVRDMEMVRPFSGALKKVSAMTSSGVGPSLDAVNYGTLSVQMSSVSNVLVRWSVVTASESDGTRYLFLGTDGKALVDASDNGWRFEIHAGAEPVGASMEGFDFASAALPRLVDRLRTADSSTREKNEAPSGSAPPGWLDACRTMELADAVEHSLQRGRTIELHYDTPSEHATFKGIMSGVGCFLLIVGLLVLVAATTAVNAGVPLADYWPYVLLAVLVAFLLLQCLRLVFPSDRPSPSGCNDNKEADAGQGI